MEQNTMFSIIIIVTILIFSLCFYFLKKVRFARLCHLLQIQDYDHFFQLTSKASTKYLFPKFNIEYLKANAYIIQGNEKMIDKTFNLLLSMRMSKSQKEDIYMKAFNYYIGLDSKSKCKELMDLIATLDNTQLKKEAQTMYDIFILKKGNYIEEMEASLESIPDYQRGITEYLLSVQYENMKDKKKAKEYKELSKKHLKVSTETNKV